MCFTWIFIITVCNSFVKVKNLIILQIFTLFCSSVFILQSRMYCLKELFTLLMTSSFHIGTVKFSFLFCYICLQWVKWNCSVVSDSCDPMGCNLPASSIHGIFQARILEWVAISFSRRSSQPRDWTQVSHIVGRCFTIWATKKVFSIKL